MEADSREDALQRVADVLAELGVEQHFTFPSTTGTDYRPPGHRGVPVDERPSEDEPPHLQGGSPHDNEPAPYDPPPGTSRSALLRRVRRLRLRLDRLVGGLRPLRVRLRGRRRLGLRLLGAGSGAGTSATVRFTFGSIVLGYEHPRTRS